MEKLWCTKQNSIQELMKKGPDKEHNFALVPCIGPTYERWNEGKCGAMAGDGQVITSTQAAFNRKRIIPEHPPYLPV
jgi:hypothetical protein